MEVDGDWVVVGSELFGISVAQSNKGVDVEDVRLIFPCGDGEESSNYVSVDCQELIGIVLLNSSGIDDSCLGQVEPIFVFKGIVDEFVDLIGLSLAFLRDIDDGGNGA